jgi:hypothetical protein
VPPILPKYAAIPPLTGGTAKFIDIANVLPGAVLTATLDT